MLDGGDPVMDPLDICRRLKSGRRPAHADHRGEPGRGHGGRVRLLSGGADELLVRPFDDREDLARIRRLLERRDGA